MKSKALKEAYEYETTIKKFDKKIKRLLSKYKINQCYHTFIQEILEARIINKHIIWDKISWEFKQILLDMKNFPSLIRK